jgi:protein-S-isoprenylcysteine O-methyltransferase Ste14
MRVFWLRTFFLILGRDGVVAISGERGPSRAVGVDCNGAVGVGICGGVAMHMGFWADCTWDTGADCAAKESRVVLFYRYVRNPMYVGFFFGWVGLWIVFGWR